MKRIFNLLVGIAVSMFAFIPMLVIAVLVRTTSKGGALHWSDRVGQGNKIFRMPKFRSMYIDTPAVVNLPPIVGQKTGENKTISCVVFM
jgi:O-antigen biosynthesis protein WbqP